MKFGLSWWAFIFPNAGRTIAAIQFENALGSLAIGDVYSAATVLIFATWLVVAVMIVRAV